MPDHHKGRDTTTPILEGGSSPFSPSIFGEKNNTWRNGENGEMAKMAKNNGENG